MPPLRAEVGIGHRHDDGEVGLGDAADPNLAAVDHPVGAILDRLGLHAGGIAARTRLGDGDGGDRFARGVGFEVLLALLRIDRRQHHVEVGRIRRKGEGYRGVAQLLVDADQRHCRQVGAARLLRHVERPQAELLALLEEFQVLLVAERGRLARGEAVEDVLLERHQFVAHELLHQLAQHFVFFAHLVHAALLWLSDALVHEFQRIGTADVQPLGHHVDRDHRVVESSSSVGRSWRQSPSLTASPDITMPRSANTLMA